MNQRPASVDSPRQKRGVFVVRRHNYAITLEGTEVFGQSQGHAGTAARIGRVSDDVLLKFRHERDARIFDAPDLLRMILRVGHQCRLVVDLPSIDAVARARGAKMRQAATILDSAQQQGGAVREHRCAGIKHTVNGIRPVLAREDWVGTMAMQQWLEWSAEKAHLLFYGYGHERISFCSGACTDRISRSAIKNDRVDSAPWFSLARSGCRPSRQPPVTESYRGSWRSLSPRNQLKADQVSRCQRRSPVTRYACRHAETAPAASIGC